MFFRDGSGYQNGGIIPQEFSEKFQTAFAPPHFRKIMLHFFSENVRKKFFIEF